MGTILGRVDERLHCRLLYQVGLDELAATREDDKQEFPTVVLQRSPFAETDTFVWMIVMDLAKEQDWSKQLQLVASRIGDIQSETNCHIEIVGQKVCGTGFVYIEGHESKRQVEKAALLVQYLIDTP